MWQVITVGNNYSESGYYYVIHCNVTIIKCPFLSLNFIFTAEDNSRPISDRHRIESVLMEMIYNSVNHSFPVEKSLMGNTRFKLRVTFFLTFC